MGEAALTVFRTIGLSVYARADFTRHWGRDHLFPGDGTRSPAMTPHQPVPQEAAAVGIGYADLCQTIVEASLEARREGV